MVTAAEALPGRDERMVVPARHEVLGTPLEPPFPDGLEQAVVGMGCFWGAERLFWQLPGVYTSAVGYAGGFTPNPTYQETCTGLTGHTEAVLVVFDPAQVPTRRSCARSGRNTTRRRATVRATTSARSTARRCTGRRPSSARRRSPPATRTRRAWPRRGYGEITTELGTAPPFYYAEAYHQQYLHKNPNGYCGIGGTGVSCPSASAPDRRAR